MLLYCWTPGLTLRRCTSPEAQTPRPSHFRRRQLRHHHLGSIHHPNTLCFAFVTLLLRSSCILLISVLRACSSLVSGCPVLPAPSSLRLYDTVSPDKTFRWTDNTRPPVLDTCLTNYCSRPAHVFVAEIDASSNAKSSFADDIYPSPSAPDQTPFLNIPGGAGTYSALGARVLSPSPQSKRVGWLVDAGHDFPSLLREIIDSWDTAILLRSRDGLTTKGWNGYGANEHRGTYKPFS